MRKLMKWYFGDWWKIMARPIYFYSFMEKGDVNDKPFSFLLVTSWILSFFITVAVFALSLSQMMLSLIHGIYGVKLLIVFPVFALLVLIFFVMVFMIVLSAAAVGLMLMSACVSWALGYLAARAGGEGSVTEMVRSVYYSTAAVLFLAAVPLLACAAKAGLMSFANFTAGTNMVLFVMVFYLWGLWSIALKKTFKLSRTKALAATLFIIVLVLLLQMFASVKVIPQLERWI